MVYSYAIGLVSSEWSNALPRVADEQMKRRASFVGWDFDNMWTICEELDYPHLWWEDRQCP